MTRHATKMSLLEPRVLEDGERERVLKSIEPFLREPSQKDEVIARIESVLGGFLVAVKKGLNEPQQPPAIEGREHLKELGRLGTGLKTLMLEMAEDAESLLIAYCDWTDEKFSDLADIGIVFEADAKLALEQFENDAGQPRQRGKSKKRAHGIAGVRLADIWTEYTGKGLSRQNGSLLDSARDDGPFPAFLRASIQIVDPGFKGVKLARQIHEARRKREKVDQLGAESRPKAT